jgi:trans-2,3-dihydro-3-hydroxyanthranilate isomerase
MVLELGVGPIACTVANGKARFVTRRPLERLHAVETDMVAAALGLAPTDIVTARHAPVMASVGLPFVFAELGSAKALARAAPVTEAFRAGQARYPAPFDFAVAPYVRQGEAIRMRMFAPLDNIPEDPATGSAAAALGALLAEIGGAALTLDIAQGVEMGRPSRIRVTAGPEGVAVEGSARRIMEGRLLI